MKSTLRMALALLGVTLALAAAPRAGHAADTKAAKPAKIKKNQAWVAPTFAAYGITTIGMAPVTSIDHVEENEKQFRNAVETGFGILDGYKLQGSSWFMESVRKAGAVPALTAMEKAALAGAPTDSATLATLQGKLQVEAILFSRLSTWTRLVVDPNTRGQSFTQVGGEFALVSLKDGAVVWRGGFLEKGDGPYNDPGSSEAVERDAGGNSTARMSMLEPPSYREVLEKLASRVSATLPKAPQPAKS
jgi:hypothetical protein